MTVAELIAELGTKDPDTLVLMDHENHGFWSLEEPNGLQDNWVVHVERGEYSSVDEAADGAVKAVRIW